MPSGCSATSVFFDDLQPSTPALELKMPIPLVCSNPRCGRELEVKDKLAGRQIQCPACKQLLRVPEQTKRAPEQTNSAFEALSQTSGKSRRGTLSSGARRMLLATGLFGVLFVALGAMGLCTYFFLKVQSLEKELAQASRRIDEPWTQEKAALEKRLKTVESEAKNARAEADFLRGRVAKSDSPPKEKIKDEKPPEGELVKETPAKDKPPTKNPAEAKEENAEAN